MKPKSKPSAAVGDNSVTTIVDIPDDTARGKVTQRRPRAQVIRPKPTPPPATRSKAVTLPRARRPRASARVPLYLLTEPDDLIGGKKLKVGPFENPRPDKVRAYEPNDLAYAMLSTRNARYLFVDRIWPVLIGEDSALVRDDKRNGWKFRVVHLEAPLMLKSPATWQLLLDAGMARKPRRKFQPSLLVWPAIKGYVPVIRALLAGGAPLPDDDVVIALLRELKVQ